MTTPRELPPVDILRNSFRYEDGTGLLYWNTRKCGTRYGALAGNVTPKGYKRVKVDGQLCLAHRIIWKMITGQDPAGYEIDHIDGNPANNRIENLRLARHGQNQANSGVYKNNSTGFRGVHWHKQHRKYTAMISHEKKNRHLGLFATAEDAARAYDAAAMQLFREFAKTNFEV